MEATAVRALKLSAPAGFVLPPLGGQPLPTRIFVSTYHDTADARLTQAGITLRHRIENGQGRWQLKLPRAGARFELERPGEASAPPDEMLTLLPAVLRGRSLGAIARLQTRRRGEVVDGVEVVVDDVTVLDGLRVRGRFTEIEAIGGDDPKALRRVGRALEEAGVGPGDGRPKVFQALGLDPAADAPSTPLAAAVRAQLVEMLRFDPGTRLGADAEDLHQFRVATRRLRALLRAARELLDQEWAESTRAELAWLGGVVGRVRDLDVLIERLDVEVAELDGGDRDAGVSMVRLLRGDRRRARAAMLQAMRDERYTRLLDVLEAGPATRGEHEDDALEVMAEQERRRLRRAAKALPADPEDAELHALRIKVKRARYAAELVPGDALGLFVRRAKAVQDVLGEHQDAVVAEERIRALAERRKTIAAAVAAGRLVERERRRADASRRAFPEVWSALEKAVRRA